MRPYQIWVGRAIQYLVMAQASDSCPKDLRELIIRFLKEVKEKK